MPFDAHLAEYDTKLAAAPRAVASRVQQDPSFGLYRNVAKRGLDIALVLISLAIVLPFVAVAALLVALDGHNPFYTQKRVGKDGKLFNMIKLRTMVPNAKEKLDDYLEQNPEARAEWDKNQKLKNDPRITTIGRVLRKTSMDELPQLFNVLSGAMSLVGPRPMMPEQRPMYHGRGYYNLRPGLTGFWQISDRNNCQFADRVKYDEAYNRAVSLGTDVTVMLRTVAVVIRGTGY